MPGEHFLEHEPSVSKVVSLEQTWHAVVIVALLFMLDFSLSNCSMDKDGGI